MKGGEGCQWELDNLKRNMKTPVSFLKEVQKRAVPTSWLYRQSLDYLHIITEFQCSYIFLQIQLIDLLTKGSFEM